MFKVLKCKEVCDVLRKEFLVRNEESLTPTIFLAGIYITVWTCCVIVTRLDKVEQNHSDPSVLITAIGCKNGKLFYGQATMIQIFKSFHSIELMAGDPAQKIESRGVIFAQTTLPSEWQVNCCELFVLCALFSLKSGVIRTSADDVIANSQTWFVTWFWENKAWWGVLEQLELQLCSAGPDIIFQCKAVACGGDLKFM